jgi:hypothetical protein
MIMIIGAYQWRTGGEAPKAPDDPGSVISTDMKVLLARMLWWTII